MFRYPKDEPAAASLFYQGSYAEGMTTELPDAERLSMWLRTGFAGSPKDISDKIQLVRCLTSGRRLLDYGCSWGYGVFQFSRAGFEAMGYEVARTRARFGQEQLGVPIVDKADELAALPRASFDIIFANHVLEHLYNPRVAFEDWRRLLAPNGILLVFVPNAGGESARKLTTRWGPMIGEKHPLAIDAAFLARAFHEYQFESGFATSPYPECRLRLGTDLNALHGDELLAVAKVAGSPPGDLGGGSA